MPDDIKDDPYRNGSSLSSTIEYMVKLYQSSGKTKANVEDMFAAILKDEKAYSTYLLKDWEFKE